MCKCFSYNLSYCVFFYSDVSVTYDAASMTAEFRFHGDKEYILHSRDEDNRRSFILYSRMASKCRFVNESILVLLQYYAVVLFNLYS